MIILGIVLLVIGFLTLDFRSFEASGLPLTLGRLADSGTAGLG
jgi:hypothetical protein